MKLITVPMNQLVGDRLYGQVTGQRDFARICERLAGTPPESIVLLDFDGIPCCPVHGPMRRLSR